MNMIINGFTDLIEGGRLGFTTSKIGFKAIHYVAILGIIILTGCIIDGPDGDDKPDDTVEPTPTTEAVVESPEPPERKGGTSELTPQAPSTPTPTIPPTETEKPQPTVEPPPEVTEQPTPTPESEPDICVNHSGIEWQGSTCLCSGLWDDVVICNDGLKIDNVSNRPCTPEASCPGSQFEPQPEGGKVSPPVTPEDPENKACSGKGKKTGNKHCPGT